MPRALVHAPLERRVFTATDEPAGAARLPMSRLVLTATSDPGRRAPALPMATTASGHWGAI